MFAGDIHLTVDCFESLWTLCIPGINAVGYDKDFNKAKSEMKEHLALLWGEYVDCDESDLGEAGQLLRELLLKSFEVVKW